MGVAAEWVAGDAGLVEVRGRRHVLLLAILSLTVGLMALPPLVAALVLAGVLE